MLVVNKTRFILFLYGGFFFAFAVAFFCSCATTVFLTTAKPRKFARAFWFLLLFPALPLAWALRGYYTGVAVDSGRTMLLQYGLFGAWAGLCAGFPLRGFLPGAEQVSLRVAAAIAGAVLITLLLGPALPN